MNVSKDNLIKILKDLNETLRKNEQNRIEEQECLLLKWIIRKVCDYCYLYEISNIYCY